MNKSLFLIVFSLVVVACKNNTSSAIESSEQDEEKTQIIYPSDVIPFMSQWKILLVDGTYVDNL